MLDDLVEHQQVKGPIAERQLLPAATSLSTGDFCSWFTAMAIP
jgi:hypothetical protein